MEAKEFMFNDLVYYKEHNEFHKHVPRSVAKIDGVMGKCITIAPDSEFLDMDEIEPIPLTVEILAKNRWFEIFKDKYEGHISLAKEDTTCFRIKNTNLCLRFVHELQHALRLYKLNEVADNLKV